MKYYIIYNEETLEFKPIINNIDKDDKYKYYIEVSKTRYNRTIKLLNSKLRKDFKWLINKINDIENYIFEDGEDPKCTTLEYHNLYINYKFVYDKMKEMPYWFFYSEECKNNFLKHCKDRSLYYHELYKESLEE